MGLDINVLIIKSCAELSGLDRAVPRSHQTATAVVCPKGPNHRCICMVALPGTALLPQSTGCARTVVWVRAPHSRPKPGPQPTDTMQGRKQSQGGCRAQQTMTCTPASSHSSQGSPLVVASCSLQTPPLSQHPVPSSPTPADKSQQQVAHSSRMRLPQGLCPHNRLNPLSETLVARPCRDTKPPERMRDVETSNHGCSTHGDSHEATQDRHTAVSHLLSRCHSHHPICAVRQYPVCKHVRCSEKNHEGRCVYSPQSPKMPAVRGMK